MSLDDGLETLGDAFGVFLVFGWRLDGKAPACLRLWKEAADLVVELSGDLRADAPNLEGFSRTF